MEEAIVGVVGTLIGTFLGWLLGHISENSYKADIYFYCNIDNLPPCLIVYCRGNKPIILRKIEITICRGKLLGKKEFFTEDVELGHCDIVNVLPGECKKIEFSVFELMYGDGHFVSISEGKREQKLKIVLTDLRGKEYKTKSKCTLKDYEDVVQRLDNQDNG